MFCPKHNKKTNKTGNEQDYYLNGIIQKGQMLQKYLILEVLFQPFSIQFADLVKNV